MKYFSLPADFKKETIDAYDRLNNDYEDSKVIDTYGNITIGNYFSSGRLNRQQIKVDLFDLEDYIKYSRQRNIEFTYTINSPYLQNREFTGKGLKEIDTFLGRLYDAGVQWLVITLPSLIELVKWSKYDFKIKASTICQIINANKAMAYKDMGVDKIVVDESINRNFSTLKRIREAFGDQMEVIINQVCDLNCIYRMFHYNMISGESEGAANDVSINYYEHRCVLQQYKSIDHLLKLSWIRPEDLKYYSSIGIHHFKLQGRHTFIRGGDPVRTLKCYFKESFDGNLLDLLTMFAPLNNFNVFVDNKKLDGFIKPFYEIENFCTNDCTKCNYCESYARKSIDYKKTKEVMRLARKFYEDYDQYKRMINAIDSGNPGQEERLLTASENRQDPGDFDF